MVTGRETKFICSAACTSMPQKTLGTALQGSSFHRKLDLALVPYLQYHVYVLTSLWKLELVTSMFKIYANDFAINLPPLFSIRYLFQIKSVINLV